MKERRKRKGVKNKGQEEKSNQKEKEQLKEEHRFTKMCSALKGKSAKFVPYDEDVGGRRNVAASLFSLRTG
jgi:hypothetical protein